MENRSNWSWILRSNIEDNIGKRRYTRYSHLYKKNINDKKERLLKPEVDITIGDEFQVLTYFFIYIGFLGAYEVNNIQDIL